VTSANSILVITTGGTIDKQYFDALSDYQIQESVITRLLGVAGVTQPFRIVEAMRKDSLDITDEDRAAVRELVVAATEARIVITHGTDTMSSTARALAHVTAKAIVLVGALAPARFVDSDASFNLGMAFATAQIAAPGVYITMNGSVFDGLKVVKDRALRQFVLADRPQVPNS
jgi:L-asparaginase